ncbi:MAG: isopentenyl phosphate kinase family protein [Candidatus Diapherotrites archaeon]|nr:isopentenyl phosphate kinase family protein [Candidatus Diapherotrites archaeon]
MEELTLVKLGGSVITEKNKPFTERQDVVERLAREIHEARQKFNLKLIIGHGGGSYPHVPAARFHTNEGIINSDSYEGIARVQDAASRLNRSIVQELINSGENAISIQLSACAIAENGRIKDMYLKPLKTFLDYGMLPVPYGDVAIDTKKGCCILSTEEVLRYIANSGMEGYKVKRVIICGRVDGVMDGNPEDPSSKVVPVITPRNVSKVEDYLAESSGIDVTGGMVQKVNSMIELAKEGITVEIINALKPNYLKRALSGEEGLGTIIRND